jgi:hypothetical protein
MQNQLQTSADVQWSKLPVAAAELIQTKQNMQYLSYTGLNSSPDIEETCSMLNLPHDSVAVVVPSNDLATARQRHMLFNPDSDSEHKLCYPVFVG